MFVSFNLNPSHEWHVFSETRNLYFRSKFQAFYDKTIDRMPIMLKLDITFYEILNNFT